MPRIRKQKTLTDMRSDLERLQQEIALAEQEQKVAALTGSPEFKKVSRLVNGLQLSDKEILDLFASEKRTVRKTPVRKKSKVTVKPKYRNPNDKKQTWTGRGRKPRWVVESLEQGKTLEDLLI